MLCTLWRAQSRAAFLPPPGFAPLCIAQQLHASPCGHHQQAAWLQAIPACAAGTRSVAMMFRAVVFTFLPTIVELGLVTTVLARKFSASIAAAVLATFVLYVAWTTWMTKVGEGRLALLSGRPVPVVDHGASACSQPGWR